MNSLIKETNDNLRTIIDTLKENLETAANTLDNIQVQMDKKVEEAKKYKIQVDSAKVAIKDLEDDNKSLEISLKELNDKYGKMNLVSVIEAGNREIKSKINDNLREIVKQKEHIAELTNKARTIKDLLMNLKKDKTLKEEKLEALKVVYNYYSERLNDVIDYAFNHSENLGDYKSVSYVDSSFDEEEVIEYNDKELENTMIFNEIANIDDNRNFKDEMSFISDEIDKNLDNINQLDESTNEDVNNMFEESEVVEENIDEVKFDDSDILESTQLFDSILDPDLSMDEEENEPDLVVNENNELEIEESTQNLNEEVSEDDNQIDNDLVTETETEVEPVLELNDSFVPVEESEETFSQTEENIEDDFSVSEVKEEVSLEDKYLDEENEERLNKINNLFSTLNSINVSPIIDELPNNEVTEKIDEVYEDTFGKSIDEEHKTETLMDIFGNPIKSEEINVAEPSEKKIEELFVENGIDFNKFKEDEQNYLKEIYNEEKFNNIFNTLKRNKINVENLYHAFNVFGEISANELENIISKLLGIGQSAESVGIILEKLPRVKKYNLDETIISYGDYIKDIEITELIMKAKELYENGGNR